MVEAGLLDIQSLMKDVDNDNSFTWQSGNNKSRIDYIWTNDGFAATITNWRNKTSGKFSGSDHKILEIRSVEKEITEITWNEYKELPRKKIIDKDKIDKGKWNEFE